MRELVVRLCFGPADVRDVGVLAEDRSGVWFEYDRVFAAGGLEISPVRLPLSRSGLVAHPVTMGAPIPGVFNDARPEGSGLKLLHRAFAAVGRASSSVSPLDELLRVEHHGRPRVPADHWAVWRARRRRRAGAARRARAGDLGRSRPGAGAGIPARSARRVLQEVTAATASVRDHLDAFGCAGPVSEAAALTVVAATERVRAPHES